MSKRELSKTDPFIETVNGEFFHYRKPTFNIRDIAWSLSGIQRFGARPKTEYSVADHSVLVARIVLALPEGGKTKVRDALGHDMREAYWMDLMSPAKVLVPDYKKEEEKTHRAFAKWAGISPKVPAVVEHADILALFMEADALMPSHGRVYSGYEKYRPEVIAMKQRGIGVRFNTRQGAYTDLMRWWQNYGGPTE